MNNQLTPDGHYKEGGKKRLWISPSDVSHLELISVPDRGDGITVVTKTTFKKVDEHGNRMFELLLDSPENLQNEWSVHRIIPILNTN